MLHAQAESQSEKQSPSQSLPFFMAHTQEALKINLSKPLRIVIIVRRGQ
jgi:hypothetical protein